MSEPKDKFDFEGDFQTSIVSLLVKDSDFNARTEGLIKPEYFTDELEAGIASAFISYYAKYKAAPKNKATVAEVIKEAVKGKVIRKDLVPDLGDKLKQLSEFEVDDRNYVIDQVATFARHQAIKDSILQSVGLLDKGKFDEIEKLIKKANEVGALEDINGYDFFEKVSDRRQERQDLLSGKATKTGITTGVRELDEVLMHGGWGRKELSLYMGGPKSGKTMALVDHARAAAFAGYNVMYCTLEVSAAIIAERLDANISEFAINNLGMNALDVERIVSAAKARAGRLLVHEFPTGTLQPKGLARLISRYKSKGQNFDLIVVDYADLMAPNHRVSEQREAFRQIYIDLRAIAQTEGVAVLTATQTNREGVKAAVARMEHIGEDINKVRTADLVISINANDEEKAEGERRLYFVASRNQEDGMSIRIKTDLNRAKFLAKILGRE
jgi:replicative DNA helicase